MLSVAPATALLPFFDILGGCPTVAAVAGAQANLAREVPGVAGPAVAGERQGRPAKMAQIAFADGRDEVEANKNGPQL
ncbi:MAG: hypothetical protein BJ554DRAFT_6873 [Olpidium bornovanus]|uniref:Uncharacterized protein n=1 Tax=Olpidium bornovanus TaxID=278681 RepID=A0A8H8A2J4_9FUNG|nr:MAG: hypothetical protein BJ554DRAFT_6873 [Olpidium bornovanus]